MEISIVISAALLLVISTTFFFRSNIYLRIRYRKIVKLVEKLDPHNTYDIEIDYSDFINAYAIIKNGRKVLIITKPALTFFTIPEFAFIMGHEIAHHQLGHTGMFKFYSKIAAGSLMETIRPKGFMESIGFTSMRNEPIWWQLLAKGVEFFNFQSYQKDEFAADKRGVELMADIGYDRNHAKSALRKLQSLSPDKSGIDKIISKYFGKRTHPFFDDRIARIW